MDSESPYDPEGPGPADEDLMDETFSWDKDTVECPQCGAPILADLGRCHACGYWLTRGDRRRWPWWVLVLVGLAAASFLLLQVF